MAIEASPIEGIKTMTAAVKLTKGQEVAADVSALLRARTPLLWVVTREEARVEQYLAKAAALAGYVPRTWDCGAGFAQITGATFACTDPGEALNYIRQAAEAKIDRCVWIMRDLHAWVSGPVGIVTQRQLRNLARQLPGVETAGAQAVIVLSPSAEVPAELAGHATVIEWPLPDRAEIAAILDGTIEGLPETDKNGKPVRALAAPNGVRDAAIDAAVGLTGEEAQSCYAKSLVQLKRIDPQIVSQEKKRIIARERVLEWIEPLTGGLSAIGGLDVLKEWLIARKSAYSAKARAYGLPSPRGILIAGLPGTGKSMTAKAVAAAWGVPLLKLDLGALKSKFVGESEGNLRKAFKVIEAIGRCVVFVDEIEKALQGATSGSADGGVSADSLSALLNWLQDREGGAFVILTSNSIDSLPPELLRKGRLDECWWTDLPTVGERVSVLQATLRSYGRGELDIDALAVSEVCVNFTGSEIAALVPEALFSAFAENAREITTQDLLAAAATVRPLAETAKEKITKLREWAVGRARSATSKASNEAVETSKQRGRSLDLGE